MFANSLQNSMLNNNLDAFMIVLSLFALIVDENSDIRFPFYFDSLFCF